MDIRPIIERYLIRKGNQLLPFFSISFYRIRIFPDVIKVFFLFSFNIFRYFIWAIWARQYPNNQNEFSIHRFNTDPWMIYREDQVIIADHFPLYFIQRFLG